MVYNSEIPKKEYIACFSGIPPEIRDSISDTLLLKTILETAPENIYFKDRNSIFLINSRTHSRQCGFENSVDLSGKSDKDFYPPAFYEKTAADEQEIIRTGKPLVGNLEQLINKDGSVIWFSVTKYPLYNLNGDIIGIWGISKDVTALKEAQEELTSLNKKLAVSNKKLNDLAIVDELSGIYNRRHFNDILFRTVSTSSRMRERSGNASFCLAIIDIDFFKNINDTYGHQIGDSVIKHLSEIIRNDIRITDYAFRYGGDEFALILPETTLEGGHEISERIRILIANSPFPNIDNDIILTVSIGVASFEDRDNVESMIRKADACLYKAKNDGRNRVV